MSGKSLSNGRKLLSEDELVISGVAGRFPDSDNMKHFQENLFNKIDLISDDDRRWKLDHPEIPQRTGKVNNVTKFDSTFFGVHFKQAHTMDPMCRMLLEHAYEAVIDAGVNPRKLRGTKTGVFIGACFSESEKTWFYEKLQVDGFGITGCSRAMLANRISYWLGVTGPSYTVDSACSSSLFAMEHAYRAIRDGLCDSAIVGGANLCLHPYVSLQFSRLGVLSLDGRCKSFDADANGYTRSEAASIIFIQKAKDAKRIYANFIYAKTNCDGYKEQGITFPSSVMQSVLLKEFYEDCGLPPTILNYVEAHGTGTKVGDPEEVNALDKIFCTGRKTPLKIGSIKSNMGHSEPASGLCSVAKVLIAMETGIIPPNLHFKRPREGVKALEDGRLKVISEPTPWEGGYVGINSFGFGGANSHVLLRSNQKEKVNNGAPKDDLPRIVAVSGRTEDAVHALLGDVESRPVDVEHVRLLQDIHSEDIPNHIYRGYTIIGGRDVGSSPIKEVQPYPGTKRPVWFVYSGMGSQWPGMGEALMRFSVFAESVRKCDAALKPHGVDIYNILTSKDKKIFDNILNSFVGIATVQIGLTDLLKSVGITPDHLIGHSVGELGCAYADGCITAEQMVLAAYSRGLVSNEIKVVKGSMAAVGLGYQDLKDMCPPDIEIACHNSSDSATISGPAESMKAFVAQLQANKIFAKEVSCGNIPYHSKYIAPAGPKLLSYLQKIIPTPKARSTKWLSTSVPRKDWNSPLARMSSAEYHTNNLLSSVLFEETSAAIPQDAVAIEIAPHSLLQAILRRSLAPSVLNVPLTKRDHKDNAEIFLQGIGKLYNIGLQPQLDKLYPEVKYPVSRGTPMISPVIKWEHSDDWYVTSYRMQEKIVSGERVVEVTLTDEDFEFMSGHVIDGRNLFPATGYLALIWETVGMMKGELYTEVSVVFEDVKFLRATTIPKEGSIELTLMVQKGTGRFEVVEGGAAVVTGYIRSTNNAADERLNPALVPKFDGDEEMLSRDIYKELRLRGYHYSGLFRGVKSASIKGEKGRIAWSNNWVAFMDNMLQMQIVGSDTRGLFVPTGIQKLVIDTKVHLNQIRAMDDEDKEFPVYVYKDFQAIVAGGVEIRGLKASAILRRKPAGEPVLEEYKFVAHRDRAETPFKVVVREATHIALENHLGIKVKSVELADEPNITADHLCSIDILEALGDMPLIQADVNIGTANTFEEGKIPENINVADVKKLVTADANALIAVGHNLLTKNKTEALNQLLFTVKDGGFIISCESNDTKIPDSVKNGDADVVLEKKTEKGVVILLRKRDRLVKHGAVIKVNNNEFSWVEDMKKTLKAEAEKDFSGNNRIIIVGEGDFETGLVGLVNCLTKEPGGEIVRGVLIQDPKAPPFSLDNPLYTKQLQMDLTINVLRAGNTWGSYRHLVLSPPETKMVRHVWGNQLVRGDLASLAWLEGPIQPGYKHEDLVKIMYAPLNFRDVMLTTGKLAVEVIAKTRQMQECVIGFEYCGIDSKGKRIMGMISNRCLSNLAVIERGLSWDVPDDWSLEEGATIPCVYGTCVYALYLSGKMKKGDKILIHAGTGGVGQAAIHLALFEGCEVFTTVGTPEKRQFIRDHFPQIPEDHIGNSRDTSFEQMVIRQTNGRGVDIVLNSLAEEKLQASIRCLAKNGRFLEIGKFDLAANNPLGMEAFLKEISFHGIMLDNLFTAPDVKKMELKRKLEEHLRKGAIKPLTRTVFEHDQLEAAFRYMGAGKHVGKVLIKVRDDAEPWESLRPALPRYHCFEGRSYILLGGLGGFGLELADWLVLRGAQNVVLTSRTGVKTGYQRLRIKIWESYGTKVVVVAGKDSSKREDCEYILKTAAKLGPIDGIFNLAVVLKDSLWENQSEETFEESFKSKAWSTKLLDELTRKMAPDLRHFVVFSSVSCGRGNAGQTNYGMSNSVMERICERRHAEGLPALAVQWGAVGDVGLVAEMQEDHKELVIGGTLQQTILSCLKELDGFLRQDQPIVSSMVVAEKRAGGAGATNIVDAVLNIMGLKDLKTVSQQTSLAELGMDSMMAVEIKQTLEREFEVFLTAQDIRGLNFAKLVQMSTQDQESEKKMAAGKGTETEVIGGMRLLLRVLGTGDLSPEECLTLPSKNEPGRSEVFLIPGIEGYGSVLKSLAEKIKSPAICLQLVASETMELSVTEMAQQLLPHVLARRKDRRDFVLVGYSFGTLVTIELARLLESKGFSGRLVLIDGSPELLREIKNNQLPSNNNAELQTNFLLGVMDMVAPALSGELIVELEKCATWSQKMDILVSRIPPGVLKITPEQQKAIVTAVYNRLLAIQSYNYAALPPINSSIILIKPTQPALRAASEDYGLRKMTKDKVGIHTVEGNHVTILEQDKVAAAINGEPLEDAEAFKATIMGDAGTNRTSAIVNDKHNRS